MEGADPFSQKLSRSKKTLVKQGNVKENSRKTPLVIEDDDASKEPSPKKAKARRPSPKKVTQEPDENPPPPIATLPPPTPSSPKSSPSKKSFSYRDYLMRKASGPIAPGSKEIPQGAPNCLAGLTFVFTGELDSLSREEAQDLVKRHGGRVTSAPSGKTNYVVVGREAGASKLEKINSLRLSTLNEDELLQMVRESNSMMVDSEQIPAGKIPAGKIPAEKASAEKVPAEKVSTERSSRSSNVPVEHQQPTKLPSLTIVHPEFALFKLWTDKYAPQDEKDLIGNHSNYEKILQWLASW